MAWNYRKRIKIAPGIHLNLSKGGVSTSIGPKGAKISIGENGTYLNTSIPGTGLYSRQKVARHTNNNSTNTKGGQIKGTTNEKDAFFKPKNTWGCVFRWLGLIAIIFLVVNMIQLIMGVFDKSEDNIENLKIFGVIAALFVIVYLKRFVLFFERRLHRDFGSNKISAKRVIRYICGILSLIACANGASLIFHMSKTDMAKDNYFIIGLEVIFIIISCILLWPLFRKGDRNETNSYNALHGDETNNQKIVEENIVSPFHNIPEQFHNKAYIVADCLSDFYDKLCNNHLVIQTLANSLPDQIGTPKEKLQIAFLTDMIKCYEQLGHNSANLFTKEGLPMAIIEGHIIANVNLSFDRIQSPQYIKIIEKTNNVNDTTREMFVRGKPEDFFYLNEVFKACNAEDLRIQYFSLLYRFFSVIAKADDHITPEEGKWLEMLMSYSTTSKDYGLEVFEKKASVDEKQTKEKQVKSNANNDDETNPLEELQTLIGLSEVKEEVSALANFVKIQQEREKKGMKAVGLSYHCVFTGNPGTGKTTVARILAAIYRDLGILKKGHLVETDRSGLVAEYVGQTAVKTNKIIDSALDGVLFIDEAYSLVQGGGNDYGQEAISTLLKRMEDDRNRLIVVLAGYSEDMKRFIDSNPGLQSRFNRYVHFSDYSADELKQIFMLNVEKNQYLLESEGEELLTKILNFAIEHKDKNFGNGRYVRNLFEKTIQNQAIRLSCQPNITSEELSKLKAKDLPTNK